jgi:hypothetical protein
MESDKMSPMPDNNREERNAEIERRLDALSEDILRRFGTVGRFRHFHIMAYGDMMFSACIIFEKDESLQDYQHNASGVQQALLVFVYAELERQGIGSRNEITVGFELDSDEAREAKRRKNLLNIPSEEDFKRAHRYVQECNRNLDRVHDRVIRRLKKMCPLHDFWIFYQGERDVAFWACIFFKKEHDLQAYFNKGGLQEASDRVFLSLQHEPEAVRVTQVSGVIQEIVDLVYAELERFGRGKRGEITVAFEFDSDENVQANFKGDYFLRLR